MNVTQLTRLLHSRPAATPVGGVGLRTYAGEVDIQRWMQIRRSAFAREAIGVGDWSLSDFQREFLSKTWWHPEVMWFAELTATPLQQAAPEPQSIGTVTLARRGEGPAAKPVAHWLAVLPAYRGRGIGRLLMAAVEAAAWNAGHRQVWLETHAGWTAAAAFYERLGYRPTQ